MIKIYFPPFEVKKETFDKYVEKATLKFYKAPEKNEISKFSAIKLWAVVPMGDIPVIFSTSIPVATFKAKKKTKHRIGGTRMYYKLCDGTDANVVYLDFAGWEKLSYHLRYRAKVIAKKRRVDATSCGYHAIKWYNQQQNEEFRLKLRVAVAKVIQQLREKGFREGSPQLPTVQCTGEVR